MSTVFSVAFIAISVAVTLVLLRAAYRVLRWSAAGIRRTAPLFGARNEPSLQAEEAANEGPSTD